MAPPSAAPLAARSHLRLFDPRLTSGLADESMHLRCIATRPPRHYRAHTLTARASGRVFCGGAQSGDDSVGRVSAWSSATGAFIGAVALDAPAFCLVVVETVRPAAPLRAAPPLSGRSGAADSFGCELLVWAGQADGRIAVLSGADLSVRATLGGHRGAVACVCSPGAPPSAPNVGAAIVLSGGADGAMRLWDARTAECLRSVPGGGAPLLAMLPIWSSSEGSESRERCRVWSAADDQTLCVWEPKRGAGGGGRSSAPQTITLNARVRDLASSVDGKVVCATAGADGALVLDYNVRLRARLRCADGGVAAMHAATVIGRGRQIWVGGEGGGVSLWERGASERAGDAAWAYTCVRRLPSAPMVSLRPTHPNQVWGGARDGTMSAWLSEAAAAEASEAVARRAVLGGEFEDHLDSQRRAVATPLLRLARSALAELKAQREYMAGVLQQVGECREA